MTRSDTPHKPRSPNMRGEQPTELQRNQRAGYAPRTPQERAERKRKRDPKQTLRAQRGLQT